MKGKLSKLSGEINKSTNIDENFIVLSITEEQGDEKN